MNFDMESLSAKLYRGASATHAGTAWLCARGYALTAAHCVGPKDAPADDTSRYTLRFRWGVLEGLVRWSDHGLDAALIEITSGDTNKIPALIDTLRLEDLPTLSPVANPDWLAFGFPLAKEDGLYANGAIVSASAPLAKYRAIELNCEQGGSELVKGFDPETQTERDVLTLAGLSGAAVTHGEAVVGLISWGPAMLGGRVIFAIPVGQIAAACPAFGEVRAAQRIKYYQNIRRRWLAYEAQIKANLVHEQLEDHPAHVPSPLLNPWQQFIARPAWHDEIAEQLRLISAQTEQSDLAWLAPPIQQLDTRAKYSVLLASLKNLFTNGLLKKLYQIIDDLNQRRDKLRRDPTGQTAALRTVEETLQTALNKRANLLALQDMIKDPLFRRCFLVTGEMGSGKTHFIANLLATEDTQTETGTTVQRPYLLLPLAMPLHGESLAELITAGLSAATGGMNWRSLGEFSRFLETFRQAAEQARMAEIRLVIALDDLEKWQKARPNFGAELVQFIRDQTDLSNVFWLVALARTSYDEVAGTKFWSEYSFVSDAIKERFGGQKRRPTNNRPASDAPNVGGWLLLDEYNRTQRLGLALIRVVQELEAEGAAVPLEGLAEAQQLDDKQAIVQQLSNPFIAWVLLDVRQSLQGSILTLNFIEFIQLFWEKRLQALELDSTKLPKERLNYLIGLIARLFFTSRDQTLVLTSLLDEITKQAAGRSELATREVAQAGVTTLVQGNLLKQPVSDSTAGVAEPLERVELSFEPFWEYHMAWQMFRAATTADAPGRLEQLELAREGVCEFLLLLLDKRVGQLPAATTLIKQLLEFAMSDAAGTSAFIWFAGPKATAETQRLLVKLAQESDLLERLGSAHMLLAYLTFVGDALPDELDLPARLKLLRSYYGEIGAAAISSYFNFILRRLFHSVDNTEKLLASMKLLTGCELTGNGQAAAVFTMQRLIEVCEQDEDAVLVVMLKYLKAISHTALNRNKPADWAKRGEPYFYRECLLDEFCGWLVKKLGYEAYEFLAQQNWYKPEARDIKFPISLEMQQQANIALGYWYRTTRDAYQQAQYVAQVKQLVENGGVERTTAFYLIRHTVPTLRQKGVRVNSQFYPLLWTIYKDAQMKQTITKYHELFEVNLGVPPLAQPVPRESQAKSRHTARKGKRETKGK